MAAKKKSSKKTSKPAPKPAKSSPKKKAAPKKAAPKKVAPKKAAPKKAKKPIAKAKAAPKKAAPKKAAPARRDRPGHIATKYGKELLAKSGGKDRDEPTGGFLKRNRSRDVLAEQLGEEFVKEVTSGENEGEDILDQVVPEETGGPFVITTAQQEFGYKPDASNPKRSRREPFPRT